MTRAAAPDPLVIGDGESILFDASEIAREFDALAVMLRDGVLYVLPRGTRKWVNVETLNQQPAKLASIKGGR